MELISSLPDGHNNNKLNLRSTGLPRQGSLTTTTKHTVQSNIVEGHDDGAATLGNPLHGAVDPSKLSLHVILLPWQNNWFTQTPQL